MNNLNDPPNWNIRPNSGADGGDGSRWNYALLVPMLGLAAFRKSPPSPACLFWAHGAEPKELGPGDLTDGSLHPSFVADGAPRAGSLAL